MQAEHRKQFHTRFGLEVFKPQLTVVIGNAPQFNNLEERTEIEQQIRSVRLLTYDELIAYGRTRALTL